jgi:hypothetical protein
MNTIDTPDFSTTDQSQDPTQDQGDFTPPEALGPTAETVNMASAKQAPTSMLDYKMRGGMGNTAVSQIQQWKHEGVLLARKKAFEALMQQGEKSADLIAQDAVKTLGEGVKAYLPPKEMFYTYDQEKGTKVFDPVNYASHAYTGIKTYQELKMKQDSQQQQQQDMMEREKSRDKREQAKLEVEKMKAAAYAENVTDRDLGSMQDDTKAGLQTAEKELKDYQQEALMAKTKYNANSDPVVSKLQDAVDEWEQWDNELYKYRQKRRRIPTKSTVPTIAPTKQPAVKKSSQFWTK